MVGHRDSPALVRTVFYDAGKSLVVIFFIIIVGPVVALFGIGVGGGHVGDAANCPAVEGVVVLRGDIDCADTDDEYQYSDHEFFIF